MTQIPDAEKLVGKYIRDNMNGIRIVGKTPDDVTTSPWVELVELNAANDPQIPPDYLITFFLQFSCYAGADDIEGAPRTPSGQPEAKALGGSIREKLDGMKGKTITASGAGSAVVTNVRFSNYSRIPDSEGFEPARERVILDSFVTMHRV